MAGFFVHRSNSMEALLGALFGVLESSPADPWTPETIVLQGRGMERWLSMSLAKQFGIWSHARYPFPRAFVDELIESVVGPLTDDPYSPLPLTLTLARLLKSSPSDVVKRYVDEDPGRRYALAARLADLFDRYQVYRPEWVLRGFPDPNHWQAVLWRELVGQVGDEHFAKRAQSASRALEDGAGALPQRITVFGITTLPPSYLRLLKSFSKRRHVHFFVQTPSREFWGDSQRQLGMFNRGDGPRLLEVLGTHARDFQSLLETMGYEEGVEAYREPGTRGVLRTLQSDLLHYRRRGAGEDVEPVARAANDVSVQIHSCHSPMREAEVVHDLLLDCFERDKRLAPHEVAVLVPRIDDYAPYIDAVFGTRAVVPYRISDRSFGSSDPELVALEAWIDAASGRLGAAQVLDILEHEPIRSAFAIEEHSLEMIRHWVVESGIRWGYDRNHRVEHGHLDDETGTWRFGFDRLWMGFAVDERRHRRVGDFAPASLVSGSNVELLGALESIVESLARAGQFLNRSHSPQDWARWLEEQVDRFTAVTSRLRAEARNATLRFAGVDPEDSEDIPFETMHQLILVPLLRDSGRFGFGSGAVTVCEMLPMRSIPFDVVIVMGMNDQDFPRAPGRDGLDLTRLAPRRGDRDPVADERNLFLEAMLSARKRLVVTYVGRSVKDNEELPPSGVVSELMEALRRSVQDTETTDTFEVSHPLHPFSRRYFDGELFTYEARYERAAQVDGERVAVRSLSRPHQPPEIETVELQELVRALRDPPAFFLERMIGARSSMGFDAVPQREAIEIDALERWAYTERALLELEESDDPEELARTMRLRGDLPLGQAGSLAAQRLVQRAQALRSVAAPWLSGNESSHHDVSREVDALRLVGRIGALRGRSRVVLTPSRLKASVELRHWIQHVVGMVDGILDETVIVGFDTSRQVTTRRYGSIDPSRARALLSDLVRVFQLGRRVPLPLFRHASCRYVGARREGDSEEEALRRAWRVFQESDGRYRDAVPAELFDPGAAVREDVSVCGLAEARFSALAERVYGPALDTEETGQG